MASSPLALWRPSLTKSLLIISFISVIFAACRKDSTGSEEEAYIENGKIWAYGSVQLSDLSLPGSIKIERVAGDQSVDTRRDGYKVFGEIEARTGGRGRRTLSYVDYHPTKSRALAYYYSLDFTFNNKNADQIYIYAILRRAGRSYHQRHQVYLGTATFDKGASIAPVSLHKDLKVSMIGDGVNAGQWALHYPAIKKIVLAPYNGRCPKFVGQMPGQNPSQNPAQFRGCRPIPAQVDLCEGNPTKAECRPQFPSQSNQAGRTDTTTIDGLVPVAGNENVYTMEPGQKDAKLVFVSTKTDATIDTNGDLCRDKFLAVAKTVGGQINDSCLLKPAPAEPVDGKLACAVRMNFQDAQTYLDKVCNITATFRIDGEDSQTIQVLKR